LKANSQKEKYVVNKDLQLQILSAPLIELGNLFQSAGAATAKALFT